MHDLSIFVGRKYYDQVPSDSNQTMDEILADPSNVFNYFFK